MMGKGGSIEMSNAKQQLLDADLNGDSGSSTGQAILEREYPEHELNGNVAAIRRIYDDNYKDLLRYSLRRVCSMETAQDIIQQAFTNTLTAVERGGQIDNVHGFLFRCVHNLCVNHTTRDHPIELNEELNELTEKSAEISVDLRERWREISKIVRKMPPSQRYAFIMVDVRGHRYEDIANDLGRSVESVRQLLSRARNKVRARTDLGSDWLGGSIPILGKEAWVAETQSVNANISTWIKSKVSAMQSWIGNSWPDSTNALLQHSASVVVGIAIVALTSVSLPHSDSQSQGSTGAPAPAADRVFQHESRSQTYKMSFNPDHASEGLPYPSSGSLGADISSDSNKSLHPTDGAGSDGKKSGSEGESATSSDPASNDSNARETRRREDEDSGSGQAGGTGTGEPDDLSVAHVGNQYSYSSEGDSFDGSDLDLAPSDSPAYSGAGVVIMRNDDPDSDREPKGSSEADDPIEDDPQSGSDDGQPDDTNGDGGSGKDADHGSHKKGGKKPFKSPVF